MCAKELSAGNVFVSREAGRAAGSLANKINARCNILVGLRRSAKFPQPPISPNALLCAVRLATGSRIIYSTIKEISTVNFGICELLKAFNGIIG